MAINRKYNSRTVSTPFVDEHFPLIDFLVVKCDIGHKPLLIVVVYVPPSIDLDLFEQFFESLDQFDDMHENNVLFLGDFNIPAFVISDSIDRKTDTMHNFLKINNFKQFNQIENHMSRLLDLVISNLSLVNVSRDYEPLVSEDIYHPALSIVFSVVGNQNNFNINPEVASLNFRKANFVTLYNALVLVDWSFLKQFNDVNLCIDSFYDKLYNILKSHVPVYKSYARVYPKWYSSDIIRDIKTKASLLKKYKKNNCQAYLSEYKRLRSLIKSKISKAHKDYIQKVQSQIHDDSKQFWSFIQSKKRSSRIPGIMTYNGNTIGNPQGIVNSFASFFESVFVQSCHSLCTDDSSNNQINLKLPTISEEDVFKAIKRLKNKMTAGPDEIPSFFVKDCSRVFAFPLSVIFNLSLSSHKFPSVWKEARICPIFKNGEESSIENYRPISILSIFSKVFEMIIYDHIYSSISKQISEFQHGFVRSRSTVTNLTVITEYICTCLDDQGQVDVIYTDFSKAFDRMDHGILLSKLCTLGFDKSFISFFSSYLASRKQYVHYNGYNSHKYIASSGVPQGSNLGPLLFLLFINDLSMQLSCEHLLYADDLKIFSNITKIQECEVLQNNLNTLRNWCHKNKLHLNISKCKIVTFSRKKHITNYNYNIDGNLVSRTELFKDLGVWFDAKLSFKDHINLKVSEACKFYGFILRNCKSFTNIDSLKNLYFAYVRSKLEYASIVWKPYYKYQKQIIEKVQRRFLKYLSLKTDGIYPERGVSETLLCNRFQITHLELRRIQSALIFLYKLLNSKIDCAPLLWQIMFNAHLASLRSSSFFKQSRYKTNLGKNSPIAYMTQNFNNLCGTCDINFHPLSMILDKAADMYDYND